MTGRTLRLLISVASVFAVFLFLISSSLNSLLPQKSKDEGTLGGPVPGLTRWQRAKFEEGKELFSRKFTVKEGLGPLYNARSCLDCHGGAGIVGAAGSGSSESAYDLFARRKPDGRYGKEKLKNVLSKLEAQDLDLMVNEGGPCLLKNSLSSDRGLTEQMSGLGLASDCKIEALKQVPTGAELKSHRLSPQVFGLGLVDAVPYRHFYYFSSQQGQNQKKQQGKVSSCPTFFGESVGRLGLKLQHSGVMNCIADEMGVQLGLSNPIHRHTHTLSGIDKIPSCMKSILPADPNTDSSILTKLTFYLSCLAPPPRGKITPAVQKGGVIFDRAGCSTCHLPQMKSTEEVMLINPDASEMWDVEETPVPGGGSMMRISKEPKLVRVRALENITFHPFSDFLLHDMGPQLADGFAQGTAGGAEWRTAPLWGLRTRHFYLHDGRAKTLEEAIAAHGGQGADAAKAFAGLTAEEKKLLLEFLNSL